jgi:hypothetical protein
MRWGKLVPDCWNDVMPSKTCTHGQRIVARNRMIQLQKKKNSHLLKVQSGLRAWSCCTAERKSMGGTHLAFLMMTTWTTPELHPYGTKLRSSHASRINTAAWGPRTARLTATNGGAGPNWDADHLPNERASIAGTHQRVCADLRPRPKAARPCLVLPGRHRTAQQGHWPAMNSGQNLFWQIWDCAKLMYSVSSDLKLF